MKPLRDLVYGRRRQRRSLMPIFLLGLREDVEGDKARLHEGYREVCMSLYNKFNFKINFNQCFRKKLNWKGTARVPSAVLQFWSSLTSFCLSYVLKTWAATVESSIFMSRWQQKSIVWTWRRRPLYWIYSYKSQCFSSFAGIVGLTGSDELLSCMNE